MLLRGARRQGQAESGGQTEGAEKNLRFPAQVAERMEILLAKFKKLEEKYN